MKRQRNIGLQTQERGLNIWKHTEGAWEKWKWIKLMKEKDKNKEEK